MGRLTLTGALTVNVNAPVNVTQDSKYIKTFLQ